MTLRLNLALVSMLLCADLSADCNALRAITGHVVSATLVDPGAATEYCVVEGSIPLAIRFTVILPTNWNGRFLMRGNGGYAGRQPTKGFENHAGYAVAYTDTGHDAKVEPLATFAYNNRAAEIDYAYRAVHLTAVNAKRLIDRHYGRGYSTTSARSSSPRLHRRRLGRSATSSNSPADCRSMRSGRF